MTVAQAQATTSAAIGVGYSVETVVGRGTNDWAVIVSPGQVPLDLQTIANFAAANGLVGALERVSLK